MVENQTGAAVEMPKYECHKIVHALKLGALEVNEDKTATLVPKESEIYAPFTVDAEWTSKFKGSENDDPGYYVVYNGGYTSWSPTDAFEEGYSPLDTKSVDTPESELEDRPGVYTLKGFNESGDQAIAFYEMLEDGTKLDGTTLEEMLRVSIERLSLLNTRFPSPFNEKAIAAMKEALSQLNERTRDRVARGVEGQHVA